MKTREQRDRMKTLLLVALVAACGSGGSEPIDAPSSGLGCSFTFAQDIPEPPPDELRDLVRACQATPPLCEPLCQRLLDDNFPFTTIIDRCDVEHSPTLHEVTIDYHLTCAD